MTDLRRSAPTAAEPVLEAQLDQLLGEALPAPAQAPPDAGASLNIPDGLPLEGQRRACLVYGLDERSGPLPDCRFAAVICRVGRYRFAVPLNMLDGVTRLEGRVTALAGQPAWHGGLVRHRGRQLTLVRLGALLGLADDEPAATADHLLVLPGGRAAVVCEEPPEPLQLSGDRIRWARPSSQRPWLAAVLPDQMCVLMDVEDIARQIGHESCLLLATARQAT